MLENNKIKRLRTAGKKHTVEDIKVSRKSYQEICLIDNNIYKIEDL